jgi:hypothetical protein
MFAALLVLEPCSVSGRHCHPSLVVLDTLACDGWQHLAVPSTPAAEPSTNTTTDYCSPQHMCVVAGDHSKWPMNALLGSQLNRRLDAIQKAHEQGCAYAHVPLQPPVEWAESHFRLGACEADRRKERAVYRTPTTLNAERSPANRILLSRARPLWPIDPARRKGKDVEGRAQTTLLNLPRVLFNLQVSSML